MAVAKIQPLPHAYGYDAASVADVTAVLSIRPPSFYVAFGDKIGLHKRALDRYVQTEAIPSGDIPRPDKPVSAFLTDLLEETVRRYAADLHTPGCLVLEGTYSNDPQTRRVARNFHPAIEHKIHSFTIQWHPKEADSLTDYASVTVFGLSEKVRYGHLFGRLLTNAQIANVAMQYQLSR